jgi:Zn-dependent protease with chaperone function
VTYFVHGATLALAWFLAANVALSVGVAAIAGRLSLRRNAPLLLALRLLPAAASLLFVALVFVPSYLKFEPRDFAEGFDLTLTLAAAAAAAMLLGAGGQATLAWWRAVGRSRAWTAGARPLVFDGVRIPAYRIDVDQPVMALAGIVRARLLVTRGLIEALTPEELSASVAHEIGHHRAWDNLKRLAMRGAPDLLGWTRAGRRLEHAWAAAAEHHADEGASAGPDRSARLALASALVKVARLMPAPSSIVEPISTLMGGGEIASRVARLLDDTPLNTGTATHRRLSSRIAVALTVAVSLAIVYGPLLAAVHRATEVVVHHLP